VSLTKGLAIDLASVRHDSQTYIVLMILLTYACIGKVNVISPGYVNTELWSAMNPAAKDVMFKTISDTLLVKHIASPDEIAEAYIHEVLLSYWTDYRC